MLLPHSFVTKNSFRHWFRRLFERSSGSRRKISSLTRLSLERLEDRLAPAALAQAGSVVTITLDNANEALTIAASGANAIDLTTTNTFTGSVAAPVTFSGFGMTSGTLNTLGMVSRIDVVDAAGNTSVSFDDSGANTYGTQFNINLDNAGSGDISFIALGASNFGKGLTALTADGDIILGNIANVAASGPVSLKSVTGNVNLAPGVGGSWTVSGGFATTISAGGSVTLGPTNVAGDLLVSAGGDISQGTAGGITTTGGFLDAKFTSSTGSITLGNMSNSFTTSVFASVTGTNTVTLFNNTSLEAGTLTLGTGALSVTAQGSINVGGRLRTDGNALFTVDTNMGNIELANSAENFIGGTVTFAQSNGGVVNDVGLRNINSAASLPIIAGLAIDDYKLWFDNASVTLPSGLTITGKLNVQAGGAIGQAGPITAGSADFTLLGNHFINLTDANNAIAGAVGLNSRYTDATASVAYTGKMGVELHYCDLGVATLTVTAQNGDITQSGYLTQLPGAGAANLVVNGGGTMVKLNDSGNRLEGAVNILGSGTVDTVILTNASTRAAFPSLPGSVTDLTLDFANAPAVFPNRTLTNLDVTAQGVLQEAASALGVTGLAFFDAGNNAIVLDGAANNFNNISLNNAGPNRVVVNDNSGLNFQGPSTLGSGALTVVSSGAITQTAAITQAANAGRATFASSLSIDLSNANNDFTGAVSLNCTGANMVKLFDKNGLTLGTVTVAKDLFVNAGGQVSQDAGTSLSVTGNTFVAAVGATLDNSGNVFTGKVGGTFTGNVTLRNSAATIMGNTADSAGVLTIRSGGAITQTPGNVILSADNLFDAGAHSVTLTESGNDFGTLSVISTGAVAVTDMNDINLKTMRLGSGALTISSPAGGIGTDTGGDGITQNSSGGTITLTAGSYVSLIDPDNSFLGNLSVTAASAVTLKNAGNLTFDGLSIAGTVMLIAGADVQLPVANLTALNFTSVAHTTFVNGNIVATGAAIGAINFTGAVHFRGTPVTLDASAGANGDITFAGDVIVDAGAALTLNPGFDGVAFKQGVWSQGSQDLTINNGIFIIGNGSADAVFTMTGGTIHMTGGETLFIDQRGTFQVGGAAVAETVTVDNGSGDIVFAGGTLSVGLGATNDKLVKQLGGSGNIVFNNSFFGPSHLRGTGLADPLNATPVLDAGTGLLIGTFAGSTDSNGAAHDLFVGSDIVTPDYTPSTLTIKQGGTLSANGVVTGFEADGDKYTVQASTGAAAKLVVLTNVNDLLDIVVRNAAAATTLTITTTKGLGDGFTFVDGIAVNGPGAVTISAAATDIYGPGIFVQSQLKSLNIHDVSAAAIHAGGTAAQSTTVTGHTFVIVDIALGSVLGALTVSRYIGPNSRIEAERFGTIKQTSPTGNFEATLVNRSAGTGALASASIAGTLKGSWDLIGSVGAVIAKNTNNWNLGLANGANVVHGNQLAKVGSLNLGNVSFTNVIAASVDKIMAIHWFNGSLQAQRFGTMAITGVPGSDSGNLQSVSLKASGNAGAAGGFMALGSLTVAGSMNSANLLFVDGNVGTIAAGQLLNNSVIVARVTSNGGTIGQLRAGAISNLALEAKKVTAIKATGNNATALFGNIGNSHFIIHGTPGFAGVAVGSFAAAHNVTSSDLRVENGSVTSFLVTRLMTNVGVDVLGSAGTIGVFKAGEWDVGHLTALAVTSLSVTGAPQTATDNNFLNGDLSSVNVRAFRATGVGVAIGSFFVAGQLDLTNGKVIRADNGIGTFTVGQDVTGSNGALISVANAGAADTVGRISALKAGAWFSVDLVANTIGSFAVTGYVSPFTGNKSQGDLFGSTVVVNGRPQTLLPKVGINSLQVANEMKNSTVNVPFGLTSLAVKGRVFNATIDADSQDASAGRIATLTAGDIETSHLRARSIGTLQTVLNATLPNAAGDFYDADVTVTGFTGPAPAPVAVANVKIAGLVYKGAFNVPNQIGLLSVAGSIDQSDIAAGFAANGKIGTLKAAVLDSVNLVTRSLGAVNVTANTALGYDGSITDSHFIITGNSAGVALGTLTASGRVDDSLFLIAAGNVTAFTAAGFIQSSLLVGFHIPSPGDIASAAAAANWLPGNFKIGSFKTTAPFSAADPDHSASFRESFVVAARLGTIALSGVDTAVGAASAVRQFGVGFRSSGGLAGTLTVNGAPFAQGNSGDFSYTALAG